MINPYEVYLYDHEGNIIDMLQRWTYLSITQRLNSGWNNELRFSFGVDNDPALVTLRSLKKDYFYVIYRTDPYTRIKSLVFEGIHQTKVDQLDEQGNIDITLYGQGYGSFMDRRVVLPTANSEYNTKTGPSETLIREYVKDSMVSPTDPARVFPGFSQGMDGARGVSTTYNARYVNLRTIVDNLIELSGLDWGVEGTVPPGSFELKIKSLWGEDRRLGFSTNPTVFDVLYGNMDIPIFSDNASEEKNFLYVGGSGDGKDRVIIEVYDALAVLASPFGRKEAFVDARQQDTDEAVSSRGYAYLSEYQTKRSLTFNVLQSPACLWIRDWGLGDLITARYAGVSTEQQISEVTATASAGTSSQLEEIITAEFQDISPVKRLLYG